MGRPAGSLNKTTAKLRKAASKYTKSALKTLGDIMLTGESEMARIAAARELLDRGHGKPPQALTDAEGGPLVPAKVIHEHLTG